MELLPWLVLLSGLAALITWRRDFEWWRSSPKPTLPYGAKAFMQADGIVEPLAQRVI
jgi:hypothetical protein